MCKNSEGCPDPTAGRAIRKADKPPEEVKYFHQLLDIVCRMSGIRIVGKVSVLDKKGRKW